MLSGDRLHPCQSNKAFFEEWLCVCMCGWKSLNVKLSEKVRSEKHWMGTKRLAKKPSIPTRLIKIQINIVYSKERMKSPRINPSILIVWRGGRFTYLIVRCHLEWHTWRSGWSWNKLNWASTQQPSYDLNSAGESVLVICLGKFTLKFSLVKYERGNYETPRHVFRAPYFQPK